MKDSHFAKLKRVSGRLRRMFTSHDEPVNSEPHLPRLLVVDDEQSIRFSLSDYFGLHEFKVDTARAVEEAARLVETTDYSVIILDLRLGSTQNEEGFQLIKVVHERSPRTRMVVLTSYGSAEIEEEAKRCGADAFLRKPEPLSQVAQVVQGLIESTSKQAAKSV